MKRLGVAMASGMLAGGLHALSLRSAPWGLLAWIALVPLLGPAQHASARSVAVAAMAYSVVLLAVDVAPWLLPTLERYFRLAPALAWGVGATAVAVTAMAYGTLLAVPLALRRRSGRALGVVWCAALWSAWEPLRTAVAPPYFPLSVLGTSQAGTLPVLQVASLTGIAGVTALVVAVNAALAQLWPPAPLSRQRLAVLGSVATIAIGSALWGATRVGRGSSTSDLGLRVLVVDGAARDAAESTLERYVAVTTSGADPRPALIIWPESALSVDLERDRDAWLRLRAFVDDVSATLVTGGVGSAVASDGLVGRFNSVHLIRPGHGMRSYHKRLLVPFAESWPAWLPGPPAAIEPVAAGHELTLFEDGAGRFGPLICFEITDAGSVRALVRQGARVVVSVNNDVWFGNGEAPHVVWARVRAVESGLPVIRAANGGVSAIIDPFGRVVASTRSAGGPVVLAGAIPDPVDTLYVRTGEMFLPACALVVALGLLPRRRRVGGGGVMVTRAGPRAGP